MDFFCWIRHTFANPKLTASPTLVVPQGKSWIPGSLLWEQVCKPLFF